MRSFFLTTIIILATYAAAHEETATATKVIAANAQVTQVEIPSAAVTQRFRTNDLYSGSQTVSVISAGVAIAAAFL
ncbi:hypothetical protein BJ741DRAFT_618031 [Chytriomyces cf. hyalinus JEL632]|nr:hypothetical protein BJ741DRAFT_618031 [Chytriomyces cf. hyalinus JEL632]